jgi:predicted PurR-regulated permease PerM
MSFTDRRTIDVLLTIAFFVLVCALIYSARRILLVFVFAAFFAYLINPIVKFMQTHSLFFKNLRGPAVVEVYITLILLLASLGYAFAPRIASNTGKLVDEVPAVLDGLANGDIVTRLAGEYGWSEATEVRFKTFLVRHNSSIQGLAATVDQFLVNAAHVVGYVLLVPVLAIFLLRDGDHISKGFIQVVFPPDRRAVVRAAAHDLHFLLAKYLSAQVLLCGFSFLFYSVTLLTLHFRYAIPLAILGAFLEFIPIAGWMITLATVLGIAFVNHSHWIWIAVLFGLWRVLQDYFLYPSIMGRHLRIHPLAAIFAILIGAEVGGIVGVYLAVPLMASLRIIWRMCVASKATAIHRRRSSTPELASSLAPVEYVGAVSAHVKAD